MADLPTHLYLTVLVRKLAGSTDVSPYFSKYGQRVSRKNGNLDMDECEFVAREADRRALMELLFVDICIFRAISRAEIYCLSQLVKKVFKPMNIDFAFKALWKSAIFRYGRFEFKAVGDSGCSKQTKRRKNARNQGNKLRPDNNIQERTRRHQ